MISLLFGTSIWGLLTVDLFATQLNNKHDKVDNG